MNLLLPRDLRSRGYNPESGIYWAMRMAKYSPFPTRISFLLKSQGAKCPICGSFFTPFDVKEWEIDHKVPRSDGGQDTYDNLQLTHKACHIKKTRSDSQRGSQ
jgi:RNA-directed DNA polymerase